MSTTNTWTTSTPTDELNEPLERGPEWLRRPLRGIRRRTNGRSHYNEHRRERHTSRGNTWVTALGWFSIGLGLAALLAPRGAARTVGLRGNRRNTKMMRMIGMREIATGAGLLRGKNPTRWMNTRVGGDVMDLAFLGQRVATGDARTGRTLAGMGVIAAITAVDVMAARQAGNGDGGFPLPRMKGGTTEVSRTITINRSPDEVYFFWRNFENLPKFMLHLEDVTVIDSTLSHWIAKGPAGTTVEWDAEMTEDVPNERISWRSTGDSDVFNEGTVRFRPAPGGKGTEIHVNLRYAPPGGKVGTAVAKIFGEEPEQQLADDLRRFKQVIEVGEIVVSEGSPLGHGTGMGRQNPAQPLETADR